MNTAPRLDPITFEVMRHKLDEITAEGYHTIGRVSGSPVVYESGDHQEAILTADGRLAAFGAAVLHWVRSISHGVRHVVDRYAENPGFADGDQWMVNDSYGAAVHAADVQLLAPVFWEGQLIAWAGTASHQQDTGGVNPGGHHVDAKDVFAEGFQTRGLKLVERGVIRADVEDTFANMVRSPEVGLLDIRAKIAANNVMKERLLGMVARYGLESVLALFEQSIDYSAGLLRTKLSSLPDGEWSAGNLVEGIVEPHLGVTVTVKKHGGRLTLDFTGSSPQSAGPENMGVAGTESCAMAPVITMLCHDIPWNEGLFEPVDFILPESSIVNPSRPAAISATIPSGATLLVPTATEKALSKMLVGNASLRDEVHAGTNGSKNYPVFAGVGKDGMPFATLILDGQAGGGGASVDDDGDDTGHNPWAVKTTISNVETVEMLYPLLYLWRRELQDSGGPGEYRGGLGMSEGIMAWGVPGLALVTVGTGVSARNTPGLEGGYPASNTPLSVARGAMSKPTSSQIDWPAAPSELHGARERIAAKGMTMLTADDVLDVVVAGGGGGVGDPVLRVPEAVAEDVASARVSRESAQLVYGVVLESDSWAVNREATRQQRSQLLAARLRRGAQQHAPEDRGPYGERVSTTCRGCSAPLRSGDGSVLVYLEDASSSEPERLAATDDLFPLRVACCAGCGTLCDVEVVPGDAIRAETGAISFVVGGG